MLKKIFICLGVLFVILASVVGVLIFKTSTDLEKHQTAAYDLSNRFMTCLLNEDPVACKQNYVHKKHQNSFDDQSLIKFANMVNQRLGKRGLSGAIEESWYLANQNNINEPSYSTITFKSKTMYQNDINTQEHFVVYYQDGKYSLQKVQVNSDKMLQ